MKEQGSNPMDLMKNREAISKLAQSGEAQNLMRLLQQGGGLQDAAQAAAAGDPAALMQKLQQLMNTQEGAQLVERISQQAKQQGLTE